MPVNWDELFKYNTSFDPQYPQQQQPDPLIGRNRFASMEMPEYNMAPQERYTQYLGSEPSRDQYKPGKFSTVLNSLSGGLEAMTSGSIGRGVQLYEGLRDREFDDAYKTWQSRGSKVKAEADLENQSYARKVGAYDKAQQRANTERTAQTAEGNLSVRQKQLEFELRKYEESGWEVKPSGAGTYVRMNPRTGEQVDTGVKITDLTPEQRIEENNKNRATSENNNRRSVGASMYSTDMTRKTAEMRDATDRYEGLKGREMQREIANTPLRPKNPGDVKPPTVVDMRTPVGVVSKGFPEFSDPSYDLVKMDNNEVILQDDPQAIERELRRMSGNDEGRYNQLKKRWMAMDMELDKFVAPPK